MERASRAIWKPLPRRTAVATATLSCDFQMLQCYNDANAVRRSGSSQIARVAHSKRTPFLSVRMER
eukprot:8553123-Lingulodinium_polyedra.AAC.1